LAENIEFSVVVPVKDEAGNAAVLAREIAAVLDGRSYEMIFVDDASRDDTKGELALLKRDLPTLRIIGHRSNSGQSRAVRTGVLAARAPVIGTATGRTTRPISPNCWLNSRVRKRPEISAWSRAPEPNAKMAGASAGPPGSPTISGRRH
jgi:hypothetical protein